jgi:hypothetical protein
VADTPFKVSRSGIESFVQCPRCFILDRVHGIRQPSGAPFTLNSLVDTLLKKEFDLHRAGGTPHPLMVREGINAIPFPHPMLDAWRQNFKGMGYLHEPTNLWIRGAIDDLWVNPAGEVISWVDLLCLSDLIFEQAGLQIAPGCRALEGRSAAGGA